MRHEIKIPIFFENLNILKRYLLNIKNLKKQHEDRYISSIYFDTKDLTLANYNLEGISNRYKFRVRWYNKNQNIFRYEIKKKINKLSQKKIYLSKNSLGDNIKDLFSNKNLLLINKIDNEERFVIKNLNLLPIIKVEYLRNYLIYKNKVRITIDHRPTYEMKNGSHISNKKDSNIIVEYKFDEIDYDVAANLIKESYFNPKRFSKYIKGLSMMNKINYF